MLTKVIDADSHDSAPPFALMNMTVGNPRHVSFVIGGQLPEVSWLDYYLVTKARLQEAFIQALTGGPSTYIVFSDLAASPTTSTVLFDTSYGSALIEEYENYRRNQKSVQTTEFTRMAGQDEGLFFDPDDFVSR
jgi:hypothetical protein